MSDLLPVPACVSLDDLAARINTAHEQCEQALKAGLAHALEAGRLLLEAKGKVKHGEWKPWLEANCSFSERTAQGYMRLSREHPKLDEAKAQRVADLSLREAIKALSADVAAVNSLPEDQSQKVIEVMEREGARNFRQAAIGVVREAQRTSPLDVPAAIRPEHGANGRKARVYRNKAERRWCVLVGPNEAGLNLKARLASLRDAEPFRETRLLIEETAQEAKELREQAQRLLDEAAACDADAAALDRCMKADLVAAAERQHGKAFPFAETVDYQIADDALESQLESLSTSDLIDALASLCDEGQAVECERGYWGDAELLDAIEVTPCRTGWTRTGGYDGLDFPE